MGYRTNDFDGGESAYIRAVVGEPFARAEVLFDTVPYPLRRPSWRPWPALLVETRASRMDVVVSLLALEGMKGAWRIVRDARTLVCGFDEWIVVRADLSDDERACLTDAGVFRLLPPQRD